ncbi:hypothetical protein JMJ35_007894 [Cladonia borealis]|uniref:AB hydrolase-1 domain-containing protein n=1 Tax=Cladonia borealis TaxID=184061 RepID=A0AA39QUM8_9LECA|nr:hypothetical protein JMJ35_007894 [Cladonia borealis]
MLDQFNGPPIPERTSARTSSNTRSREERRSKEDRRRRSLPPASPQRDARRRDSNRVVVQPASTEVISSLIETLSAISSPVGQHFDTLPQITASHSTPSSPGPWQSDFPSISEPGSATNPGAPMSSSLYGVSKRPHGVDASYLLHPDHASIRVAQSRGIPQEFKDPEDLYDLGAETYSIGNVSIEPGLPPSPSAGTHKARSIRSVKSTKSLRSLRSLGFRSSRDSLREPDGQTVRKSKRDRERDGKRGRVVIGDYTPPHSPLTYHATISKESVPSSVPWEMPSIPARRSSIQSTHNVKKLYWNANDVAGSSTNIKFEHGIPGRDYIPQRESSKRHSLVTGSPHQRKHSRQSEADSVQEAERPSVESHPVALKQALEKVSDDPTEDLVSRRIKELKDQKSKRDRSSMEDSSGFLTAPETPERSLTASPSAAVPQSVDVNAATTEQEPEVAKSVEVQLAEDIEDSAPSPAVAPGVKRSSGSYFPLHVNKTTTEKESGASGKENVPQRSVTSPQRSNSRLLKRLSQHGNPTTAKHKRTYSNPLGQQSNRNISYQSEKVTDPIDDEVARYLSSPRLNQRISNPQTGRVVSFSEVGVPDGSVVFCCVGMGLTRFLTAFYDELASTLKLRLITPDRPGVGGSEPHADGLDTPLGWPDDVRAICEHLRITKFSIMAHSAGAIYALATALRMPQHIRCRVHLLAPWIPPSQMSSASAQQEPLPASALPYSQRFLRALPTTFLRAANSNFLSTTSSSITTSLPKSPRRANRRNVNRNETSASEVQPDPSDARRSLSPSPKVRRSDVETDSGKENDPSVPVRRSSFTAYDLLTKEERKAKYDSRLTEAIWNAATTGANPAVDLLVCLERRQPIGFRYVDITRAVVIHHGSKDTRVPVENVKWLGKTMRRCEVRILEGEGHGLMASAAVMGNVLMEIAGEWDDWNRVVRGKGDRR